VSDVTRILSAIDAGDPHAADELLPLVYDELRRLAAQRLAREPPGQSLQPTALVHEAYVRLVEGERRGQSPPGWNSRGHFYAAAAEAMRRILIEVARRKRTHKHGGQLARRDIDQLDVAAPENSDEVLALDEALTRLAAADHQAAEVVRLRFFAGLPLVEVAEVLDISPRTTHRLWTYARAWLDREIRGSGSAD
jgi:RNA polymerase sigma factor (TIGR02999 family)